MVRGFESHRFRQLFCYGVDMKKFMLFWPVIVVVSCLLGIVANIVANNEAAVMAYFLALMGWAVLAYEGIVEYRAKKQAK